MLFTGCPLFDASKKRIDTSLSSLLKKPTLSEILEQWISTYDQWACFLLCSNSFLFGSNSGVAWNEIWARWGSSFPLLRSSCFLYWGSVILSSFVVRTPFFSDATLHGKVVMSSYLETRLLTHFVDFDLSRWRFPLPMLMFGAYICGVLHADVMVLFWVHISGFSFFTCSCSFKHCVGLFVNNLKSVLFTYKLLHQTPFVGYRFKNASTCKLAVQCVLTH